MNNKDYRFAGYSRRDGTLRGRFTNRDNYADILRIDGDLDIHIVSLPTAMSKSEASKYLLERQDDFRSPEVRDCLAKYAETPGQRIMRAREELGLSIAEVAKAVKRSKECVWGWEYHNRIPRDGKLAELAKLLRVSERWLREGGPDDVGKDFAAGEPVSPTPPLNQKQGLTGAELLSLARKALATEQSVHESCVSINVSIKYGGDASEPGA